VPVQGCNLPLTPSSAVVKKEYSSTSTPPMDRTACTEPQCLYKDVTYPSNLLVLWSRKSSALPLLPQWAVRPVQSLCACTRVHLTPHPLLVSWSRKSRALPLLPYRPYGLYRASVPVQRCNLPLTPSSAVVKKEYSCTSTPPMGRTACTEHQCLYRGVVYVLPYTAMMFKKLKSLKKIS